VGEEPRCVPVGDDSEADQTLEVELSEWAIVPRSSEVSAGKVNIVARNIGEEPHEVVVVRGSDPASLPRDDKGTFDEEAYGEERVLGEIESFPAGETCNGVFDLEPGDYLLVCNITEVEESGEHESHFDEGMVVELTVT
jgi:hypothetical protein